jgi:hypothetical protein
MAMPSRTPAHHAPDRQNDAVAIRRRRSRIVLAAIFIALVAVLVIRHRRDSDHQPSNA